MKESNFSTYLYAFIFCSVVAGIIAFPGEAVKAASEGLMLWFNVVCPALLPFFICIEVLIGLGIVSFLGSSFRPLMKPVFNLPGEAAFGFFMSISSGYPVGAKITAKLREEGICTRAEGQRMLSLCSTSGPLFIIGAVATGIMNNAAIGFLLALSHYLSAIAVGFCFRFYATEAKPASKTLYRSPLADMLSYRKKDGRTIGILLGDAVKNGINLILLIGGFIIFFAVITRILKLTGILDTISELIVMILPLPDLQTKTVSALLVGILEVTNGIKECAALNIPLLIQVMLVSFMIGFGGLSVNAQVLSIVAVSDLSFGLYFIIKLLQGFFAAFFSFLLYTFAYSTQAFNRFGSEYAIPAVNTGLYRANWLSTFTHSFLYLTVALLFILLINQSICLKKARH